MADRARPRPLIIGGSTRVEQVTLADGETVEVVSLATGPGHREYMDAAVRSLRGRGIRAWTRQDRHPPALDGNPAWWEILVQPQDVRRARLAFNQYTERADRRARPKRSGY
jgi:hypothetical protein